MVHKNYLLCINFQGRYEKGIRIPSIAQEGIKCLSEGKSDRVPQHGGIKFYQSQHEATDHNKPGWNVCMQKFDHKIIRKVFKYYLGFGLNFIGGKIRNIKKSELECGQTYR